MKTTIINRMLKNAEIHADAQGYDIDSNAEYVSLIALLIEIEFDGKVPTFEEKAWASEVLKNLYAGLGLDYASALHTYIDEEWRNGQL